MIVTCPHCQCRLRYKPSASIVSIAIINCPKCKNKFKVRTNTPVLSSLIAHEDELVCQQLVERLALLGGTVRVCRSSEEVIGAFSAGPCVLLLDVAFEGCFPFQLVEKICASGQQHKIVLISSVYNRTAYKKRPESLYGADAYLELHHIGDRLLPLLAELYPSLATRVASVKPVRTAGTERSVVETELVEQADTLAKLLVADILLYHQDRMQQGLASGQVNRQFATELAEGRRMLALRLPQAQTLNIDFIEQAFDEACRTYSNY